MVYSEGNPDRYTYLCADPSISLPWCTAIHIATFLRTQELVLLNRFSHRGRIIRKEAKLRSMRLFSIFDCVSQFHNVPHKNWLCRLQYVGAILNQMKQMK